METIEYKNPHLDRTLWAKGIWDDEPDKKRWQDEATGLPCLIVRNYSGALCGYVGLPPSHPLYGKSYDEPNVEVHGGLTFAGKCQERDNECEGVCHKAPPGEDDVFWFGFDCHHHMDKAPQDFDVHKYLRMDDPYARYRDFAYVTAEVESLARQLKDAA